MGKKPYFSIIIPVYNVESYLSKCIDSVLAQTFHDYEIILVNDGSTDTSGDICRKYATDSDIIFIDKENGGQSSARNAGLNVARGEYVIFIDSDDYWNQTNALELIFQEITQKDADIVLYGCENLNIATGKRHLTRGKYDLDVINSNDKATILCNLFATNQFPGSAWIMCVSRNIIETSRLRFPENITGEDIIWINHVLVAAENISAINEPIYTYIVGRNGQITSKPSVSGCKGMILAIHDWLDRADRVPLKAIDYQMAHILLVLLMHFSKLDKKERQSLLNEVVEVAAVARRAKLKDKMVYASIRTFGPYFTGKIIANAYSLKKR